MSSIPYKAVMVRRLTFRFQAQSETLVEDCLRRLGEISELDEERETFLFTSKPGVPAFGSQCVIVQGGVVAQQSGDYSFFLGRLVEALAAVFGKIHNRTGRVVHVDACRPEAVLS